MKFLIASLAFCFCLCTSLVSGSEGYKGYEPKIAGYVAYQIPGAYVDAEKYLYNPAVYDKGPTYYAPYAYAKAPYAAESYAPAPYAKAPYEKAPYAKAPYAKATYAKAPYAVAPKADASASASAVADSNGSKNY